METKVELYESMMVSTGKTRPQVWNDMAVKVLNESYFKDLEVYGTETRELYAILFEDATLFESIDERVFQLNEEDVGASIPKKAGWMDAGAGSGKGGAHQEGYRDAGTNSMGAPNLSGFGSFASKIKGFFETFGGNIAKYFSNGIAGVIANPLPLVAAGAGVGLIAALIAKFKKLSDSKKAAAMAKLKPEQKKNLEANLAMSKDELKDKLSKSVKSEKAASVDTDYEDFLLQKAKEQTAKTLAARKQRDADDKAGLSKEDKDRYAKHYSEFKEMEKKGLTSLPTYPKKR